METEDRLRLIETRLKKIEADLAELKASDESQVTATSVDHQGDRKVTANLKELDDNIALAKHREARRQELIQRGKAVADSLAKQNQATDDVLFKSTASATVETGTPSIDNILAKRKAVKNAATTVKLQQTVNKKSVTSESSSLSELKGKPTAIDKMLAKRQTEADHENVASVTTDSPVDETKQKLTRAYQQNDGSDFFQSNEPNEPIDKPSWFTIEKALPVGFMSLIVLGLLWVLKVINDNGYISSGMKLGSFFLLSILIHVVTVKKVKDKQLISGLLYGLVFTIGILTTFTGVLIYEQIPLTGGLVLVAGYIGYGFYMSYRENFQPLSIFISLSALMLPYLLAGLAFHPVIIYTYIGIIYTATTLLALQHQQLLADTLKNIFSVLAVGILLLTNPGSEGVGHLLLGLFILGTFAYWPLFKGKQATTGFIFTTTVIFSLFNQQEYRLLELAILLAVAAIAFIYTKKKQKILVEIAYGVMTLLTLHLLMPGPTVAVVAVMLGLYIGMRFEIVLTFILTSLAYIGYVVGYILFDYQHQVTIQWTIWFGSLLLFIAFYQLLKKGQLAWTKADNPLSVRGVEVWNSKGNRDLLKGIPVYLLLLFYVILSHTELPTAWQLTAIWLVSLMITGLYQLLPKKIPGNYLLLTQWAINAYAYIGTFMGYLATTTSLLLILVNLGLMVWLIQSQKAPQLLKKWRVRIYQVLLVLAILPIEWLGRRLVHYEALFDNYRYLAIAGFNFSEIISHLVPLALVIVFLLTVAYLVNKKDIKPLFSFTLMLTAFIYWLELMIAGSGAISLSYLPLMLFLCYMIRIGLKKQLPVTSLFGLIGFIIMNLYCFTVPKQDMMMLLIEGLNLAIGAGFIYHLIKQRRLGKEKIFFEIKVNHVIIASLITWVIFFYDFIYLVTGSAVIVWIVAGFITLIALWWEKGQQYGREYLLLGQSMPFLLGYFNVMNASFDLGILTLSLLLLIISVSYTYQLMTDRLPILLSYLNGEKQIIIIYVIMALMIHNVSSEYVINQDSIIMSMIPSVLLIVYTVLNLAYGMIRELNVYRMLTFIALILLLLNMVFVTFAYMPTLVKGITTLLIGCLGFIITMKITKKDRQ